MKKLFLRAEFGPLWEPWEEDEIGRKKILVAPKMVSFFSAELTAAKKLPFLMHPENISALRIFVGFTNCGLVSVGAMGAVYVYLKV